MEGFLSNITLKVNENIYIKDPDSSELGHKIVQGSISLINDIGFEQFNFKKLSKLITTTEASIYRYFENKHKLLIYLTEWYWNWLDSKLVFSVANITDPRIKLEKAIKVLVSKVELDGNFSHINEVKLHNIIVAESIKVYFTKSVDKENQEGAFSSYKQLILHLAELIVEANSNYAYPNMLASSIVEGVYHQRFLAAHFPVLTHVRKEKDTVFEFYKSLVVKAIFDK